MFTTTLTAVLAASASLVSAAYIPTRRAPAQGQTGTLSISPHDLYSSSIGVLGCKVDTNRIAYWPNAPDCNNICVKVSHEGRSVHLLRVDQSGGAHDISYDAWNYLTVGKGAAEAPSQGPAIAMEWEPAKPEDCKDLMDDGKLPLSASNSMNFLSSCLAQPESYVAKNHVLYNINNAACTWGVDEKCTLDLAVSNQPSCPHQLGAMNPLSGMDVMNIAYGTGKETAASI